MHRITFQHSSTHSSGTSGRDDDEDDTSMGPLLPNPSSYSNPQEDNSRGDVAEEEEEEEEESEEFAQTSPLLERFSIRELTEEQEYRISELTTDSYHRRSLRYHYYSKKKKEEEEENAKQRKTKFVRSNSDRSSSTSSDSSSPRSRENDEDYNKGKNNNMDYEGNDLNKSLEAQIMDILHRPISEVLDRMDEVDVHAYEDLVPLEVKLALEERVFGWSHLSSVILGHVTFTILAYFITYTTVTQIYYHYTGFSKLSQESAETLSPSIPLWFNVARFTISFFSAWYVYGMVRRRSFIWLRNPYGSKAYEQDEHRRRRSVLETDKKTLLGILRRKKNAFTQRSVKKKLMKAQASFEKRRVQQQQQVQLYKRQQRLEERKAIPKKVIRFDISFSSSSSSSDDDDYNMDDKENDNDDFFASKGAVKEDVALGDEHRHDDDNDSASSDMSTSAHAHYSVNTDDNRSFTSFHTEPTNLMESIMHDQILFKHGPIINMPYAHGGFFGAAPFMLANPYWISILRHLMPDVYVEISRRVAYAPAHKLIHWAENNPVVAAYGTAHELEYGIDSSPREEIENNNSDDDSLLADDDDENSTDGKNTDKDAKRSNSTNDDDCLNNNSKKNPPNLEWDVFLNPVLVQRVERVLYEREKFIESALENGASPSAYVSSPLSPMSPSRSSPIPPSFLSPSPMRPVPPQVTPSGTPISEPQRLKNIVKYYDIELKKRVHMLVDKMLIAHGNLTQLILEQTGSLKRYNYSRVERTRSTLGGGIYARQWMAVYAAALRIGILEDEDVDVDDFEMSEHSHSNRLSTQNYQVAAANNIYYQHHRKKDAALAAYSKCPNTTIAESVDIVKSITQRKDPIGLVLDIKSRHVNKRVWACVVDILRSAGVRVEGISSFTIDEIRDISGFCKKPVNEIIFFHSAGDLQVACHNGTIRQGDKAFFNAGSLIWERGMKSVGTRGSNDVQHGFMDHLQSVTSFLAGYDPNETKHNYRILPFAQNPSLRSGDCRTEGDGIDDSSTDNLKKFCTDNYFGSTIQQYKERFNLSIGVYCQEFAIDEAAANLIVQHVNETPHIYDLGLSWGGVNGITIRGIQSTRFSSTDGYWNQRFIGAVWDCSLFPPPLPTKNFMDSPTTPESPYLSHSSTLPSPPKKQNDTKK